MGLNLHRCAEKMLKPSLHVLPDRDQCLVYSLSHAEYVLAILALQHAVLTPCLTEEDFAGWFSGNMLKRSREFVTSCID